MSTEGSRISCITTITGPRRPGEICEVFKGVNVMDGVTRRTLLAATAAGGIFAAATTAGAETSKPVPQPMRPEHGGTDPGPA
jgi:hypothetical protein